MRRFPSRGRSSAKYKQVPAAASPISIPCNAAGRDHAIPVFAVITLSAKVRSLPSEVERRRRLVTRAFPLVIIAIIAFVAGAIVASESAPEKKAAERFVSDWVNQDFAAMHRELNAASQQRYSAADLRSAYLDAEEKATLRTLDPGG